MSIPLARHLRRNETRAERVLWEALRHRRLSGFKFRRQHPIAGYIVDFACIKHWLIVEADGGQHTESPGDADRASRLQAAGWRVVGFWNNDILGNTDGVVESVLAELTPAAPPDPENWSARRGDTPPPAAPRPSAPA